MKKQYLFLSLIAFLLWISTPSVSGQNKPCNNFDCAYLKAENFLKQAAYQKALDNLDSAEGYLTDTNTKEKEQIKQLRRRLFVAIEKEKVKAQNATKEAKKQTEIAKAEKVRANMKAEEAHQQAEIAKLEKERADSILLIAQKNTRTAENLALAEMNKRTNPTLALRIYDYNHSKHPENSSNLIGFYKLLSDSTIGFYSKNYTTHSNYIWTVKFSPNGKTFLTGSADYTAKLWNTTNGKLINTFECDEFVTTIAFSLLGDSILTNSNKGSVTLWNCNTGEKIKQFTGHKSSVQSVVFSPNGKFILTGSYDGTAIIWDINTGLALKTFACHDHIISTIFSDDGNYILTTGNDKLTKIWDINTGNILKKFSIENNVYNAIFSSNGKVLLTMEYYSYNKLDKRQYNLWNVSSGQRFMELSDNERIVSAEFSKDCSTVLTCSEEGNVKLWNTYSGKVIRSFIGHTNHVRSCSFSPDEKLIITSSHDTTVKIWRNETFYNAIYNIDNKEINSIDISPSEIDIDTLLYKEECNKHRAYQGVRCGFSINNASLHLFNIENKRDIDTQILKKIILFLINKGDAGSNCTQFAYKDNLLLNSFRDIISSRTSLVLWDISRNLIIKSFNINGEEEFEASSISPDNRTILASSYSIRESTYFIRIWDIKTKALLIEFRDKEYGSNVSFSSNGKEIIICGQKNKKCKILSFECNWNNEVSPLTFTELKAKGVQLEPEDEKKLQKD